MGSKPRLMQSSSTLGGRRRPLNLQLSARARGLICGFGVSRHLDQEEAAKAFVIRLFVLALTLLTSLTVICVRWQFLISGGVLLTIEFLLIQVFSKRCDWELPFRSMEGKNNYLWICSDANYRERDFVKQDTFKRIDK